jgi:hypothetical protein
MACTGLTDDVVEIGGSLRRQFPRLLEREQPLLAIRELFHVTGRHRREESIDGAEDFLVRAHLRRPSQEDKQQQQDRPDQQRSQRKEQNSRTRRWGVLLLSSRH